MAETLRQRLTRGYSYSIYIDGVRTFAATNETYHADIKQYAALNFTDAQLLNAFSSGWITQTEYDETLAIKYPGVVEPPPAPAVEPIA